MGSGETPALRLLWDGALARVADRRRRFVLEDDRVAFISTRSPSALPPLRTFLIISVEGIVITIEQPVLIPAAGQWEQIVEALRVLQLVSRAVGSVVEGDTPGASSSASGTQ